MNAKISASEVNQRLRVVRSDGLVMVESTYVGTHYKAKFMFMDGNEWWAIVKNVLNGAKGPRIVTEEELKKRILNVHGDTVTIDMSTFTTVHSKARFVDKVYGEWWAPVKNVYSLKNGHPKRGILNRRNTCLKKYGSPNPTGNVEVKRKRDKNNIEKYGVPHVMQVPEFSLKSAEKSNNSFIKIHWKTGEKLICQASYENKVVDYLNKNKINFLWQPETFNTPNNKTYRPDLFLIDDNKWVEIKGFFRKDALEKWNWFLTRFPNAELWDKKKLKEMGIL